MQPLKDDDPRTVGRYAVLARLGEGGMGEVFLARAPNGVVVALKMVRAGIACDDEFRRRFRQEVIAARRVGTGYTAAVVDADPENDRPWLATIYIPGPTLSEAVRRNGALSDGAVWRLALGLVEALNAIHEANIIHRDLKPSNVLLSARGPRVVDFGIARLADTAVLTRSGAAIGTPAFMSPEQFDGGIVGPASDVFSLGSVLSFAATGEPPFGSGSPMVVLKRVISEKHTIELQPGPLRDLVLSCIAPDPAARPSLNALRAVIAQHERGPSPTVRIGEWRQPPAAQTQRLQPSAVPAQRRTAPAAPARSRWRPHRRSVGRALMITGAATSVFLGTGAVAAIYHDATIRHGTGLGAAIPGAAARTTPATAETSPLKPPGSSAPTTATPNSPAPTPMTSAAASQRPSRASIQPTPETPSSSCLLGRWSLTSMTVVAYFDDLGRVEMSLVDGGETRRFDENGTTTIDGDALVEGEASTGEVVTRGGHGGATGNYRIAGGTMTAWNVSSHGRTRYWLNGVFMGEASSPMYRDGAVTYACTPTSLTLGAGDTRATYERED